jgi:hypothetical protein
METEKPLSKVLTCKERYLKISPFSSRKGARACFPSLKVGWVKRSATCRKQTKYWVKLGFPKPQPNLHLRLILGGKTVPEGEVIG